MRLFGIQIGTRLRRPLLDPSNGRSKPQPDRDEQELEGKGWTEPPIVVASTASPDAIAGLLPRLYLLPGLQADSAEA